MQREELAAAFDDPETSDWVTEAAGCPLDATWDELVDAIADGGDAVGAASVAASGAIAGESTPYAAADSEEDAETFEGDDEVDDVDAEESGDEDPRPPDAPAEIAGIETAGADNGNEKLDDVVDAAADDADGADCGSDPADTVDPGADLERDFAAFEDDFRAFDEELRHRPHTD